MCVCLFHIGSNNLVLDNRKEDNLNADIVKHRKTTSLNEGTIAKFVDSNIIVGAYIRLLAMT